MLFTINLRYETRQDLVINLIINLHHVQVCSIFHLSLISNGFPTMHNEFVIGKRWALNSNVFHSEVSPFQFIAGSDFQLFDDSFG